MLLPREKAGEIWRRIRVEFTVELPLLKARWKQVLFGGLFQYLHGVSTQLAHRMHRPLEQPLHDVGFEYLPELGVSNAWLSESIFWALFVSFVLWTFTPFVTSRKRFYTAVIYARLLMVLCACQFLRIVSFTVTQLPAPNYHCHAGRSTAVLAWPPHWWQHVVIDVGRQATHGCGDLIFSSHTTFVLVGCLTYTEYGSRRACKLIAWVGVAVLSLCIVASHKHYSVDVVVAWYTVPLVFHTMLRRWTTKRPLQEHWPHRPAVGEEGAEYAPAEMLTVFPEAEGKSLLPLLISHVRGRSMDSKQGPNAKPADSQALLGMLQDGGLADAEAQAPLRNGSPQRLGGTQLAERPSGGLEDGAHAGASELRRMGSSANVRSEASPRIGQLPGSRGGVPPPRAPHGGGLPGALAQSINGGACTIV